MLCNHPPLSWSACLWRDHGNIHAHFNSFGVCVVPCRRLEVQGWPSGQAREGRGMDRTPHQRRQQPHHRPVVEHPPADRATVPRLQLQGPAEVSPSLCVYWASRCCDIYEVMGGDGVSDSLRSTGVVRRPSARPSTEASTSAPPSRNASPRKAPAPPSRKKVMRVPPSPPMHSLLCDESSLASLSFPFRHSAPLRCSPNQYVSCPMHNHPPTHLLLLQQPGKSDSSSSLNQPRSPVEIMESSNQHFQ